MKDFEKLGLFYLGRELDPETKERRDVPVLYDASDLVTHAVIVVMTGSGKTGQAQARRRVGATRRPRLGAGVER